MVDYREEFGRALEAIEAKVIEAFAMIAEDLPRATAALLSGDAEVLTTLVERQREIDAWYSQVEEMVSREILRQAPVASDLRFLLSVLGVARDFERAHCSVVKIAARANHDLRAGLSPGCRGLIERMGELAAAMWGVSADAWYQRDRSAMDVLVVQDADLDELCAGAIAELASGVMTAPVTIELTLVARSYERVGDHAVNVAGRVAYLAGSVSS